MRTYKCPVPVFLAGLVAAALICCRSPGAGEFQLDRNTGEGERLWVLDVGAPGQDSCQVDRWVAGPLVRALAKDGRIDVAAVLSECERARVFFRARVHLSSVDILTEVIGSLKLPDMTEKPNLSPAGSGGWPGKRFGRIWIVRVTARSVDQLEERMGRVEAGLGGSDPFGTIPSLDGFIRAEIDHALLAVTGVRPGDVYRKLRRVRADRVERLTVKNRRGEVYALGELARLVTAYVPDKIIRLNQNTFAGYLLFNRPVDGPGVDYASLRSPEKLPDAEGALLGAVAGPAGK